MVVVENFVKNRKLKDSIATFITVIPNSENP